MIAPLLKHAIRMAKGEKKHWKIKL
jgi:hypothetical protein